MSRRARPASEADARGPAPARHVITWVVPALAVAFIAAYAAVALARMRFPFELEWMEGGMLTHVRRLLDGRPLYVAPSLEFVPFIYPPFWFEAAAALARVFGAELSTLRMLSFAASLGCFALVFAIVRRGTSAIVPALAAAGLFAACYREGGAWLDIARVDSLALCLVLLGWHLLRTDRLPWVAGAAAGVAMALAFLTKQVAAAAIAPALVALALTDRRRLVPFAAAVAVVAGGATWWLERASGGWYRFYVFDLPRDHPIIGQLLRGFWIGDLLGPVGIALAIGAVHFFAPGARADRRRLVLDGGIVLGLVAAAYLTRIRVGSYDNVVLPAYLGAAVAFGLGLATLDAMRRGAADVPRRAGEAFVAFLCIAQFAALAYKPWQQVPPAADVAAGEQIVESLRRVQGDVWVPYHPLLAEMAGKPAHAHDLAVRDVLRPGTGAVHDSLRAELARAIHGRRFAAIVLDGEVWMRDEVATEYDLRARMFGEQETDLFWPVTGFYTRPDFVWLPKEDDAP